MKAQVRFIKRNENNERLVVKEESFQTKKLARKSINDYLKSVTIHQRIKQGLEAYIVEPQHPYCL